MQLNNLLQNRFKKLPHNSGLTLLELMVAISLSGFLVFLASKVIIFFVIVQDNTESKVSSIEISNVFLKKVEKSKYFMDLSLYNPRRTFFIYREGFCREGEGSNTSYFTSPQQNTQALYGMKNDCVIDIDPDKRRPFWSATSGASPNLVPPAPLENGFYLDSWTMYDYEGLHDTSSPTVHRESMNILISRCLPIGSLNNNESILNPALNATTAFNQALSIPFRPVIKFDVDNKPKLHCCNTGTNSQWNNIASSAFFNCPNGDQIERFVFKTFSFPTIVSGANNQSFRGFAEMPSNNDTNHTWGLGFVNYFADAQGNSIKVMPFTITDFCKQKFRTGEVSTDCLATDMISTKLILDGQNDEVSPTQFSQYLRANLYPQIKIWTTPAKRNISSPGSIQLNY